MGTLCAAAAEKLSAEGIDAEVIDLRTLWPYDWEAIKASVEKTGRVLFVNEDTEVTNFGEHLVRRVVEELFFKLLAPPKLLAGALLDLARSSFHREAPEGVDFATWTEARFGRTLYRTFFAGYTEKLWGVPPETLSGDWAEQRISLVDLRDVARRLLPGAADNPRTYARSYRYPRHGFGVIFERLASRVVAEGATIRTGVSVTGFELVSPHAVVACAKCHVGSTPQERFPGRAAADCRICHTDVHRGQFTHEARFAQCSACHAGAHFVPSTFGPVAHAATRWPLTGAHEAVGCSGCHRVGQDQVRVFHGTSTRCVDCHRDVHDGARRDAREDPLALEQRARRRGRLAVRDEQLAIELRDVEHRWHVPVLERAQAHHGIARKRLRGDHLHAGERLA